MHTDKMILVCALCIMAILSAGCSQPARTSSGPGPVGTESSASGNAQTMTCTISPPADPAKSGVLEITSAQGEVITKNVIMISGKIRNNAGEGTSSGVAAKLCNTRTGTCVKDMVGEIFKPHETVDYSLIPLGGCPDTTEDLSTCQCEVWIDILR